MMKRSLFLSTLLTLVCTLTASAALTTGLYRLTSGRSSDRVMAVSDQGAVIAASPATGDLKQVWIVEQIGSTDKYTLRNASTGTYIQKESGINSVHKVGLTRQTYYIKASSASGYYNISADEGMSGNVCLHEDAQHNVVLWAAGGSGSGSAWKFEAVSEPTLADMRAILLEKSGCTTLQDEMICRIIARDYNRAMVETLGHQVTTEDPADDALQYWRVKKSGSGYAIQNIVTNRYIQKQSGALSKIYTTGIAGTRFTISENKNFKVDYVYDIPDANGVGLHCASSQGYNVVGWYTSDGVSNTASTWVLQKVELSDDDIAAAQQRYAELNTIKTNASKYATALGNFFEDAACTTLKEDIAKLSDAALRDTMQQSLCSALVEMAVKVKNNSWAKWEKEFRVARYGAFSDPDYWAGKLQIYAYDRQNGPTGVLCGKNDPVFIMVGGNIPTDAKLVAETQNGENNRAQTSLTLKKGLNVLIADMPNSQVYINYVSKDGDLIANYPELDIHIEGGTVNGYFDCRKHSDAEWVEMQQDGLFTAPIIDVVGEYTRWHMDTPSVMKQCPKQVNRMMALWDSIVYWELDLMGLTENAQYPDAYEGLYPSKFNNRMACISCDYNYMFASWYGTYYNRNTLPSVLNYDEMSAGGGALWGPAHEIGHMNQGAIQCACTAEVSNNLFSNVIVYRFGTHTSRYWTFQYLQPFMAQKASWPDIFNQSGDYYQLTRMYFNLYLYFHGLGYDPAFYPKVFKALRKDPLVNPKSPTVTQGKNDYLKFARVCAEAAKADLSEYFAVFGFWNPCSKVPIADYSSYIMTTTQNEINTTRDYIRSCGEPLPQLVFVEDRVKSIPGVDGKAKRPFEEYTIASCANEMGQYTDIPLQLEASGYYYSATAAGAVTVPSVAKNALGFKVYDKNGELVYAAASRKFTLPSWLAQEGGYTIYAQQSDGSAIKLFNNKTDTYYTMRLYRGSSDAVIRYTDGLEESGTIPVLTGNDIAILGQSDAPELLKQMPNVIAKDSTTTSLAIDGSKTFYAPYSFTAKNLTFTGNAGPRYSVVSLPFAVKSTDLPGYLTLETLKGTYEKDDTQYLIADDQATAAEAGVPFFLHNKYYETTPYTIQLTDALIVPAAGTATADGLTLSGGYVNRNIPVSNYVLNDLGSAFVHPAETVALMPFSAYLSSTNGATEYVIAHEGLTGIQTVGTAAQAGTYYDLQGRKVANPVKGQIYIQNGKKVMVK